MTAATAANQPARPERRATKDTQLSPSPNRGSYCDGHQTGRPRTFGPPYRYGPVT